MSKVKLIIKYFIFVTGLFFMGLGISLTAKSNLGATPISSVPYVLSKMFPLTFGQLTFLVNMLFILTEFIIMGKDLPKKQYLQVAVCPLFGFFVDFGMKIFTLVNPESYIAKAAALLLGCLALAFGVYLQIAAKVIMNSGEGLVKAISIKTNKEFGTIKIIFDSTLALIALIISLFVFRQVVGLREGTVISALLVGTIVKFYSALFQKINLKGIVQNIISNACTEDE